MAKGDETNTKPQRGKDGEKGKGLWYQAQRKFLKATAGKIEK